jgi:hypothetical protein
LPKCLPIGGLVQCLLAYAYKQTQKYRPGPLGAVLARFRCPRAGSGLRKNELPETSNALKKCKKFLYQNGVTSDSKQNEPMKFWHLELIVCARTI